MSDLFRIRNPVLLASSSRGISSPDKTSSFTEETLRKALYKIFRLPTAISLLLGISIFKYDGVSGSITCSFWSLPTFVSVIRVPFIFVILHSYVQNREVYMKIFGDWGATEEFSHGMSIVSILICDVICAGLTFKNVKSAEIIHKRLLKLIMDVVFGTNACPGVSSTCVVSCEDLIKKLKRDQRWIERTVYTIVFLFVLAYLSALKSALNVALILPSAKNNIPLLITLPFLILYYIGVHILRQIAYYAPIGTITLLCFGIFVLQLVVDREIVRCKKLSQQDVEKAVNQLFEHFQTIYEIVDDLNMKHQWVLITGVVSLLIIIICTSFQLCVGLRNSGPSTLLGTSSIVLSNSLTFYSLCFVSSLVTGQTKKCMSTLRNFILEGKDGEDVADKGLGEINMSKALKQKIRMWHMEGSMQPPAISPGYFFTLRRRIIPPILAMLITYLLVLVQFQLKDQLENETRQQNILQVLKNYSLNQDG